MAYCANEACRTELAACDSTVRCQQCLGVEYCGEVCRTSDWVKHKCPNALLGATPSDTHVIPYAWEDEMPPEALAEEIGDNAAHPFLQSYSTTHYARNGQVVHTFLPALVHVGVEAEGGVKRERVWGSYQRGVNPIDPKGSSSLDGDYSLSVDQLDRDDKLVRTFTVKGSISLDSIYSTNVSDRVLRLLGKLGESGESKKDRLRRGLRSLFSSVSKEGDRLILWPDMQNDQNRDAARTTPFDTTGTLRIRLNCYAMGSKDPVEIFVLRGQDYNFGKGEWLFKMARSVDKIRQTRLRAKFPGDDSIKTMSGWRMEYKDTRVTFIIQQVGTRVYFRDFEFAISPQLILEKMPQLAQGRNLFSVFKGNTTQMLAGTGSDEEFDEYDAREVPPPPAVEVNSEIHIGVDPTSLDQVTGLVMALEHRGLTEKGLEPLGAILRPYARELCDKRNGYIHYNDVPDDVHTAIALSLERLARNKRIHA